MHQPLQCHFTKHSLQFFIHKTLKVCNFLIFISFKIILLSSIFQISKIPFRLLLKLKVQAEIISLGEIEKLGTDIQQG
jgi:hypothetical protein